MNRISLQDKVAVVTGGARGIGRAIVLALCSAGARCVFTYAENEAAAHSVVEEAKRTSQTAVPLRADVREYDAARALIDRVNEQYGRFDILVNNAGITRDRSLMAMTREDWQDVIDTDLTGVFNMSRASIVTFLKQKSGNIVNIASVSGIRPLAGQSNYAAAKAGVIGFTKSLAREVAPYNVRVNAVAPGFIESDMTAQLSDKYRTKVLEMIPLGRFGTADEVAASVLFLLRDASQYITGQVLQIDGGMGM